MKLDNRISLQKLEVFCLVVQLRSVSRAAERLFVTQPVVSAHLHSLQTRVGVQLFRRDGRGIELTEAGVTVHTWAADLLRRREDLAEELDYLERGEAGSVVIGSSMSVGNYLLPPVLIDFRRSHPAAEITLNISNPELALDAVRAGDSDFCVVASTTSLTADVFDAELIGEQQFVLVAAATDTSVGDRVSREELSSLSFVCPPRGLAIRRSQDSALAALGITRRKVSIELGSAEAMKKAVAAGLGVALLWSASVRDDIDTGVLRRVEIENTVLRDQLFIAKRHSKRLTALQSQTYTALTHVLDGDGGGLLDPSHPLAQVVR